MARDVANTAKNDANRKRNVENQNEKRKAAPICEVEQKKQGKASEENNSRYPKLLPDVAESRHYLMVFLDLMNTPSEPRIKISLDEARGHVQAAVDNWVELLKYGDGRVGLYAPKREDTQEPHDQDEVYIISRGKGKFRRRETVVDFVTGDALFVAAHVPHRFEDFSDDFETWVVFFGPANNERDAPAA